MQTPDQSPNEKQPQMDQSPHLHESNQVSPTDPLHVENSELAKKQADSAAQTTSTPSTPPVLDNEAIRQGLVYPPPPSFYESYKAPEQSGSSETAHVAPPFPIPAGNQPAPPPLQGMPPQPGQGYPWGQSVPPGQPGYPPFPQGQYYLGTQPPPFVQGPPPVKKSRKWLWITISTLTALVLLSCCLCTWQVARLVGPTSTQVFGAVINGTQVSTDYYVALQNQQYPQAYSYLSPEGSIQGITSDQFIAKATKQDDLYGPVLRYTVGQPILNNYDGKSLDSFTIKVDVSRKNKNYTSLLHIKRINNEWKITDFDQL